MMQDDAFTAVARLSEIAPGKTQRVDMSGRSILLCNSDGRIHAVETLCSHAQESLECGRIRLGWIACPAHGARFDLETGEALTGPATEPIATFPVRILGDIIEVAVP